MTGAEGSDDRAKPLEIRCEKRAIVAALMAQALLHVAEVVDSMF